MTDSRESDGVHKVAFENTDSSIDKPCDIYCEPTLIFKKPHGVRGGKQKIIQEGREERLATMTEKKEAEFDHPIQIFFKSMASTVMTFPPELMVETRMLVNNIVSEMELRSLKTKNNTHTTSNIPATTTHLINNFSNTVETLDDSSNSNSSMSSTSV